MDWNDLRYFLAVVRAGALTGAARELGVEHSTVGRRLAALEKSLGARLFTRGPSGLALTEAGSAIRRSAELIAEEVAAIERRIAGVDARVEGVVRLTIPESVDEYFVQQAHELRGRHPGITIDLVSDDEALDIRSGLADVAVRFCEVKDPDLMARRVGTAGWSLYASHDYVARRGLPKAIDDMTGHEVVGYSDSVADVVGARWQRNRSVGGTLVMRASGTSTVCGAVAAGLGVAPLPCIVGDRETRLVRLTPDLVGSCPITLVIHPDLTLVARIRKTIDFLVEVFDRDGPLWNGRVQCDGR